jgi:hypothetical protein
MSLAGGAVMHRVVVLVSSRVNVIVRLIMVVTLIFVALIACGRSWDDDIDMLHLDEGGSIGSGRGDWVT